MCSAAAGFQWTLSVSQVKQPAHAGVKLWDQWNVLGSSWPPAKRQTRTESVERKQLPAPSALSGRARLVWGAEAWIEPQMEACPERTLCNINHKSNSNYVKGGDATVARQDVQPVTQVGSRGAARRPGHTHFRCKHSGLCCLGPHTDCSLGVCLHGHIHSCSHTDRGCSSSLWHWHTGSPLGRQTSGFTPRFPSQKSLKCFKMLQKAQIMQHRSSL